MTYRLILPATLLLASLAGCAPGPGPANPPGISPGQSALGPQMGPGTSALGANLGLGSLSNDGYGPGVGAGLNTGIGIGPGLGSLR